MFKEVFSVENYGIYPATKSSEILPYAKGDFQLIDLRDMELTLVFAGQPVSNKIADYGLKLK